jgi:hypothetical protein
VTARIFRIVLSFIIRFDEMFDITSEGLPSSHRWALFKPCGDEY